MHDMNDMAGSKAKPKMLPFSPSSPVSVSDASTTPRTPPMSAARESQEDNEKCPLQDGKESSGSVQAKRVKRRRSSTTLGNQLVSALASFAQCLAAMESAKMENQIQMEFAKMDNQLQMQKLVIEHEMTREKVRMENLFRIAEVLAGRSPKKAKAKQEEP